MTENFHIVIEVKKTDDGTFIRAHIDGAEAPDVSMTRALVQRVLNRLLAFVVAGEIRGEPKGD